jgi:hypothetical protein
MRDSGARRLPARLFEFEGVKGPGNPTSFLTGLALTGPPRDGGKDLTLYCHVALHGKGRVQIT